VVSPTMILFCHFDGTHCANDRYGSIHVGRDRRSSIATNVSIGEGFRTSASGAGRREAR
jgi:hypothetical protein